eukprot:554243-Ditylum_brightwellii.AAC.1
MGWQKKGLGHTYDSISGHALMSGARAKLILACMICCKFCGICNATERVGKVPEEHECCKNDEGSSKGMEAFAALELIKKTFNNRGFIVVFIVANNDSSMKALLCHSYEDHKANKENFVWPQTPSKDRRLGKKLCNTGKLPLDIPKPKWFANQPTEQRWW